MVPDPLGTTVTRMKHTPAKYLASPPPPPAGSSLQQLFPFSHQNGDIYSKGRCRGPTRGRKGTNLEHYFMTTMLITSALSRVEQSSKTSTFLLTHLYHASQSDGSTHYFSNISTEVKTAVTEYCSTRTEHCQDDNINRQFLV